MNSPSGSSVNKWLSRTALTLALTAGADMGTTKEADAAPGDQVTKITNPDVYICTSKPSIDVFAVKVMSIINNLTKPKGQDVTIKSTTELEQKVSGLSQDVYGEPVTTYRNKYHVIYWPGDAKFEEGYYFIDKDETDVTKKIALKMTPSTTPGKGFYELHIIEGTTPTDDRIIFGVGATILSSPMQANGTLQLPALIKETNVITDEEAMHGSTMIGIKYNGDTGVTTLKRFAITKDDIVEKESITSKPGPSYYLNPFITYKNQQGKEETYIVVEGDDFPTGTRRFNIADFKDFKDMDPDAAINCYDGRFEFRTTLKNNDTVIVDTWNPDPKTNTYTITAKFGGDIAVLQGYDKPTFEVVSTLDGKHWLLQMDSLSPLNVKLTEYYSASVEGGITNLDCIPNPQPPAPIIETKPAVVEGAETTGAETSSAETTKAEVVEVDKPDAGSGDSNNSDGDATGSPETIGSNDATQPSDAVKPADGTNPTDADDAVTQPKDIPLEQETDAGPTASDNGTQPTEDEQIADAGSGADTISATDTATIQPKPSSPSPSANSGCSATPGTTRTSTRSALAQLGFLMTIAAGAQMMRRRKEDVRK